MNSGEEFGWPVATGRKRIRQAEDILLEARILAVADTIEAMASHRPYRPGAGIDEALAEIKRGHS